MKKSQKELIEKFYNNDIENNQPTMSGYEPVKIKIEKVDLEVAGEHKTNHPLLNSESVTGQEFLVLKLYIKFEDGTKHKHVEVQNYYTKSGRLAYYPTYDDVPGTFLFDVIEKSREYDTKQNEKLEDWKPTPNFLEGLVFDYEAKRIAKDGETFIILKTPRQDKKDEEYKNENKESQKLDDIYEDEDDEEEKVPF